MSFDLAIRNGQLFDGLGGPPVHADVGIRGERIVAVGKLEGTATREIDASGKIVTPGFVDIHAHLDAQIFWDPLATSACWHGITSVVMGNCGVTFAPCHEADRSTLAHLMESVEDIPAKSIELGMKWRWQTFGEYLNALETQPLGINAGGMVGHSAVRFWAMGGRALSQKIADPDDVEAMREIVGEAISNGALGFSTSRTHVHRTPEGDAVPGTYADENELMGIARAVRENGGGVFQSVPYLDHTDVQTHQDELELMVDIGLETGLPVTFAYVDTRGLPNGWREAARILEQAEERGANVLGQTQVRSLGMLFGLVNNTPWDRAGPNWIEFKKLDLPARLALLQEPAARARLVAEADASDVPIGLMHMLYRQRVEDGEARYDVRPEDGLMVLAEQRGVTPADAFLQIAEQSQGKALFIFPIGNHDFEVIGNMLDHPRMLLGLADSGAHCGQIMDASLPSYLLSYWVRERGIFPLERAIEKLSSEPARFFDLTDRGVIREGAYADLNVIDFEELQVLAPEFVFDLPGGAGRFIQKSSGLVATVVNGTLFMEHGEHTGALAGQVLRRN
ncbi:MAG: amidohydrolase family protein [bacterium]|nr:amidohydrolase family protein [bacterium]MCP5068715.1 amidohydrolase family protein [bacterium]